MEKITNEDFVITEAIREMDVTGAEFISIQK